MVGEVVQAPSSPLVTESRPIPRSARLIQPSPWSWGSSTDAVSGSGPRSAALPLPWALPTVCPPMVSATVSSSFIAIRPKVTRMSRAVVNGSGEPPGPSGLT